jgi:hypothetical protein
VWSIGGRILTGKTCSITTSSIRKIEHRDQRTDIGKYCFVNRNIKIWIQLPAEVSQTFPCKPNIFRKRVRKAIINGVK